MSPDKLAQAIPLLIWLLLVVILGFAVCVSVIACLSLKGSQRAKAIDVLLVLSTVTVAIGYIGNVLPHDALDNQTKKARVEKAIQEVDMMGNRLSERVYISQLPQPFSFLVGLESSFKLDETMKDAQSFVEDKLKKSPTNGDLISRLAILKHENGADVKQLFEDADDKHADSSNSLVDALRALYTGEKAEIAPDVAQQIENRLPKGWYRDAALLYFYKTTNAPNLDSVLRDRKEQANAWKLKMEIGYTLRTIFCLIGLVTIFRFCSGARKKEESLGEPQYFPFRNWYGCALALMYAEFFTSVAAGFFLGFFNAMFKLHLQTSSFLVTISGVSVVVGAIVFLLCVDFFIRKSGNKTPWSEIFAERVLTISDFLVTVFSTFCAAHAIGTVFRIIVNAIPNVPANPNNAVQAQMVDALSTSNSVTIVLLTFLICVLAPLLEEAVCRRFMYPWIRHRTGMVWAIVITSLIFALFHLDINGLIYYFALGVTLNLLYEKKRNLWANIAVHALWNTWVVVWMTIMMIR